MPREIVNLAYALAADVLAAELEAIKGELIGWLQLGGGAYLHRGEAQAPNEIIVIQVVGIPNAAMAAMNVLLLA